MTSSPCEAAALPGFDQKLASHGRFPLTAVAVDTLQVNVGRLCNQACRHCHVDAGPHRIAASDNMSGEVVDQVIRVIRRHSMRTVDITGGAPELNPHFRRLVSAARETGARVIDRCNLTVLVQPGQEDLCAFLAAQQVEVIASLPYYVRERTDAQRGSGVFDASLAGLRLLNAAGYGTSGGSRDGLVLTLVDLAGDGVGPELALPLNAWPGLVDPANGGVIVSTVSRSYSVHPDGVDYLGVGAIIGITEQLLVTYDCDESFT